MRRLFYFLLFSAVSFSTNAQWVTIGNPSVQRMISGSDTTYRNSQGSAGYVYWVSKWKQAKLTTDSLNATVSGTQNSIPKFITTKKIGNSKLSDDGSNLKYERSGGGSFRIVDLGINNLSIVAGGDYNEVTGGRSAILSGGQPGMPNRVWSGLSVITGGYDSHIDTGSIASTILGPHHYIRGGHNIIAGGSTDSIMGASYAFVTGLFNKVTSGGLYSFTAGANNTNGGFRSVLFGNANSITGRYSMIAGGELNRADGSYSFVFGRNARALASGTFVVKDSVNTAYSISTPNYFAARFANGYEFTGGNFGINTNSNPAQFAVSSTTLPMRLQYGTAIYSDFKISSGGDLGIEPTGLDVNVTGRINATDNITAGASSGIYWQGRSRITSPSNGTLLFTNNTGGNISLLGLGGTGSNDVALAFSTQKILFRLGDNTGYSDAQGRDGLFERNIKTSTTGMIGFSISSNPSTAFDVAFSRPSLGLIEVNSGTNGDLRNLSVRNISVAQTPVSTAGDSILMKGLSDKLLKRLAVLPVSNGGTNLSVIGSANQMLRVNPAGTALEYFTPSFGSGTVTSFGKTDGYGIISSVANPTTAPNHTISIDSTSASGVVSKDRLNALNATVVHKSGTETINGSKTFTSNIIAPIVQGTTLNDGYFETNSGGPFIVRNQPTGNALRVQQLDNTNTAAVAAFSNSRGSGNEVSISISNGGGGGGSLQLATSPTAARKQTLRDDDGIIPVIKTDGSIILPASTAPAYGAGKLFYDSDNESLSFYNNDANVSMQIGQEAWVRVVNNTGSTIANGAAVYINGSSGGLPTIALAQSNSATTTVGLGLTTESIANGATGYVTSLGVVNSLNTSSFSVGAVYLSNTVAGGLTQTVPNVLGQYRYRVGFVTSVNASIGKIHVTPTIAVRVSEITNTTTTGLSTATLNATYTSAQIGDRVLCGSISLGGAIYTKFSTSGWLMQSAPVNP